MRQAVNVYGGPFAPLLESEWAQEFRMRLEERFTEIAGRLTTQLLGEGDYAGAQEVCAALLEADPYNETAVGQLMHAQAALGDADAALRAYRRYADVLDLDLGVKPGHEVQRLLREIRSRAKETPLKPP